MPAAKRPLRLAFIAPGNSIHTRRWLEYFAERGHEVGLISYGRFEEPMEGIQLLDELTAFSRVERGRRGYLDFVVAARRVRRVVRRFAPDVVHAHFVTGPGWLGVLSGTGPLVVTAWGSDVLVDTSKSSIVRALHRLTFHRAACVMCDAEGVAERLADLGASPVRIRRALWGVDVELFSPAASTPERRAVFGLPPAGLIVLSIRGLRDLQNPLTVVRAFAALHAEHPDATLALKLGPADAELAPAVAAEIDALGIGPAVSVIGHMAHDRLAELYRVADVCLSVPSSDGTSVALLEAMATGRPVVVSDIPANREWVTEGESGVLVPPGDAPALSDALLRLARSPELRAAYGAAARANVEVAGSYHHQMRRAEMLYRSVIWERAHS
jgi:glycosyltransferase involved in cell wall biosynthesis